MGKGAAPDEIGKFYGALFPTTFPVPESEGVSVNDPRTTRRRQKRGNHVKFGPSAPPRAF